MHNNPFHYTDPDGSFAFILPLVQVSFGVALNAVTLPAVEYTVGAIIAGCLGWKIGEWINKDDQTEQSQAESPTKEQVQTQNKPKKRTEPRNLGEQLALEKAKTKPKNPDDEIMADKINDPRYPRDTWKKNAHVHTNADGSKTDIHYWENRITGEKEDFKFKDY